MCLCVNFCLAIIAPNKPKHLRDPKSNKKFESDLNHMSGWFFLSEGDTCHIGHENTRTHYDTIKSFLIFSFKGDALSVSAISKPTDLLVQSAMHLPKHLDNISLNTCH